MIADAAKGTQEGAVKRDRTRMEWIAEQMAENGMVTQAREVVAMETALQSAHAALAEAQRTVRNLELANGEARKTIDRLSAMCPQDACNGSAALSSTGEGSVK